MLSEKGDKILVVGYGNSVRSDDGIGLYIAERLGALRLSAVDVIVTQQLVTELVESFGLYSKIIFVDARQDGPEIHLRKLDVSKSFEMPVSHHLGPEVLVLLAAQIYHSHPQIYICTVRGENFDYGTEISESVRQRAEEAIRRIYSLISEEQTHARR
ncbi:MAG: hydrogenase maturation protease [Candidatus Omnitrophica bacterium]|nr:hydrogenase maturation protease [Candidatus Omnitrophota bacterium]